MKTSSILTLVSAALLIGGGWAGIRTAQALQEAPVTAEKPALEKGSGDSAGVTPVTESTPEQAAQADLLLENARSGLANRQSLQAEMRQQIIVGDRRLTAEGTYISAAPYPKLRLEYRIRVGTMQGSLTEICDGRILHTTKTVGKAGAQDPKDLDQQYSRRDVERILAARDVSLNLPLASQGAELGIGGLPAILASIDRCMKGKRVTEEEFEGQKCQVFHGVWDQDILQKYDSALKQAKASLVPFFPDKVQLFLTADTLTPVKIVYLKNDLNEAGKLIAERALMILEFSQIQLDLPIPPETFQFVLPSGKEEIDRTTEFLNLIKQADAELKGTPAVAPALPTRKAK